MTRNALAPLAAALAILFAGHVRLASQSQVTSAAVWIDRMPQFEAHLKTAQIVRLEDIGTGVTNPKRAYLMPTEPFDSLVWKMLPPGRRNGHWESYKSEIAAYELDKLLHMNMVPPAVERTVDGERGAAIEWLPGVKSVKQTGGKMPTGPVWGRATRRMLTFDALIANTDRNAGNILLGKTGELILIDHSRAFTDTSRLPRKIERVDAELWGRIQALKPADVTRVLEPWIGDGAVQALFERRTEMAEEIDKLVTKTPKSLVIVD
jgi:hypothetical protein